LVSVWEHSKIGNTDGPHPEKCFGNNFAHYRFANQSNCRCAILPTGLSLSPQTAVPLTGDSSPVGSIAQRQIRVSRAHIPAYCYRRKALPTSIKTLGNLIQIKRHERRLPVWQLALKMGIAAATVRAWESGVDCPNDQQMRQLASLLKFEAGDATKYLVGRPLANVVG